MFNSNLHDCYETVIAAMAAHIEQLQNELRWTSQRVETLEKLNTAMRVKLARLEAADPAADVDPFGGDEDE